MEQTPPVQLLDQYTHYLTLPHPLDALNFKDPWVVGCGLICAAHCSDAAVNKMLPRFRQAFPCYEAVLGKNKGDLVPLMPGISHSGNKAQYILNWAQYLHAHRGDIETSTAALTQVKGIGRKTAGILLHIVKGIDEALPLDVHALRILDRLGWYEPTKNANVREKQLAAHVPQGRRFNTFLILTHHGRQICGALKAKCGECGLRNQCAFASGNQ